VKSIATPAYLIVNKLGIFEEGCKVKPFRHLALGALVAPEGIGTYANPQR
jgi:hypothetical protein